MHIRQYPTWDANDQDLKLPPGFVLYPARHVDNGAGLEVNFLVVQSHPALPADDVIDFVGSFVEVKLGVGDLQVMNFRSGEVLLFDEWADLAAGLRPGFDLIGVAY